MDFFPNNLFDALRRFTQPKRAVAEELVRERAQWALGVGLIPVAAVDLAALTALQLDLIRRLAKLYEVPFSQQQGQALLHALSASGVAVAGASMVKAVPGIGTLVGGVSMAVLAGGSTYAVGQVCIDHFEKGGTLDNLDFDTARKYYTTALEKGYSAAETTYQTWQKVNTIGEAFQKEFFPKPKEQPGAPNKKTAETGRTDRIFLELQKLNTAYRNKEMDTATFELRKKELLDTLN